MIAAPLLIAALAQPEAGPPADPVEAAVRAGRFFAFVNALVAADLLDEGRGDGPVTLFAPNDDAFDAVPGETRDRWRTPEGRSRLRRVLAYHIVPGRVDPDALLDDPRPATREGARLTLAANRLGTAVDGATILDVIGADRGVLCEIDRVLEPPPPALLIAAEEAGCRRFAELARAAGLADRLDGGGPWTLLGLDDEAFERLPIERRAALDDPATARAILGRHLLDGALTARALVTAGEATGPGGGRFVVTIDDGRVRVGGAALVRSDLPARDGWLHVVDAVPAPE